MSTDDLVLVWTTQNADRNAWMDDKLTVAIRIHEERGAIGEGDRQLAATWMMIGTGDRLQVWEIVSPFARVPAQDLTKRGYPYARGGQYFEAVLRRADPDDAWRVLAEWVVEHQDDLQATTPWGAPCVVRRNAAILERFRAH
jgi:hypothetical protein